MAPQERKKLTLLPVPAPLRENPYQALLYQELESSEIQVLHGRPLSVGTLVAARGRPRVLHVHWLWLKQGRVRRILRFLRLKALLLLARLLRWRVVWTAHNLLPHDGGPLDRALHDWLARHAAGIIVHERTTRDRLCAAWPVRGPVEVIPHGHYRDHYPPAVPRRQARARLGLADGGPVLLFFGQIRPYKGVDRLISAFRATDLRALLLVAGRPAPETSPGALERLAVGDPRIRLDLRWVPDEEVPVLFGAADWVVLPFRRITTSGSAILALTFGRPLIIPREPALLETTGQEAVVTFDREEDLGPALRRAVEQDARGAAEAAGRRAETLDWKTIARRTEELLWRAVGDERGGGAGGT